MIPRPPRAAIEQSSRFPFNQKELALAERLSKAPQIERLAMIADGERFPREYRHYARGKGQ